MALLPSQVDVTSWNLAAPRSVGQMSIASITTEGQPPLLQLVSRADIGSCTTPFAPSVFRGTGEETRKSVVFTVPEETAKEILKIEEWASQALQKEAGRAQWCSCIRRMERFPPGLKAKINTQTVQCFDLDDQPRELPEDWHGLAVAPILQVRGVYLQKQAYGLIVDCIAMMVGEKRAPAQVRVAFV